MGDDGTVTTSPPRWQLALAGVLTGLAGIATSEAAAAILHSAEGPVVAVSGAIRDLTPGPVALNLIHLVGHWDKPLLVGGTSVGLLALCAYAGLLSRRRPLVADLIFFALAGLGLAAVVHAGGGVALGIALVVGLITWIVVLRVLTGRPYPAETPQEKAASRRTFLVTAGAVAVGALGVTVVGRVAGKGRRAVEQARRMLRLPVSEGTASADVALLPDISPWRTPNDDFYLIHTAISLPNIAPTEWRLRVHGMVENELSLTYEDLIGRQLTEDWVTLCCVSNEIGGDLIGNAHWSGVLIRDVLAQAGVSAKADAVLQTSEDGWNCGTPLAALTDNRNAMLAVAMNGRPLPVEHGFPVRMVVPGLYGYVSATKWLVDLEVTRFDRIEAYWTKRGWSAEGPVRTMSRIDVPRSDVEAGTVAVGGVAWSQHTGIEKVEYQLDGGPWQSADLGVVPTVDTWVQWAGRVQVRKGHHRLVVRATDRKGYTQTSVRRDVVPDGATGWHSIEFDAS